MPSAKPRRTVVRSGKPETNGRAPVSLSGADPLLRDLATFIRRFVVMTDDQLLVVALWVIHTHCISHVVQTPYLSISSPDSECGKSRLMEVLEVLVRKAWMVIRPSDAVAYRYIDAATPTLLLDEFDTIFNSQNERFHEGLRAIIDAGHRRGARVPRAADFGQSVEHFSPFCAKALAGIGNLPETIARRSIYVRLARKKSSEHVERFIRRDVDLPATELRQRLTTWAANNGTRLADARPAMPEQLSDRMQEGCEFLVAIADALAAGEQARAALVELLTGERLDNQETIRTRLLRDLKLIWDAREAKRGKTLRGLSTQDLIKGLVGIEESPWRDYYGRGSIEPHDIASLLRHYGIGPKNIKFTDGSVRKGYRRDDLYAAWDRYLR